MSSHEERQQQAAAAAGGALLGAVVAGPLGGIVGAYAGPMLVPFAERIWDEWRGDAQARAGAVVGVAAEALGVEPQGLVDQVLNANENTRLLAGLALAAALRTVNEDKIRALGRALSRGLDDDARVEEELLIVKALEDLEAPHIEVLELMATKVYWVNFQPEPLGPYRSPQPWHPSSVAKVKPGVAIVLPTLLGALERHGLIEQDADMQKVLNRFKQSLTGERGTPSTSELSPRVRYVVTDLGVLLLGYLRQQHEQQPRPSEE